MPNPDTENDDEDAFDPSRDMLPIVNVSSDVVRFEIAGRKYKMKPGDITQIEGSYAMRRQMRKQGDALPSVIELETGKKVLPLADPRAQHLDPARIAKQQKQQAAGTKG